MSLEATTAPTISAELPVVPVMPSDAPFLPLAPADLRASGLQDFEVEALVLKSLYTMGAASSRQLAEHVRLPGDIVRGILDRLRAELLVVHRGTSDLVDFIFQLTDGGIQRVKQHLAKNSYCGSAPVTLDQYIQSVDLQSHAAKTIRLEDFRHALAGIYLTVDVQSQFAQAVNAGRGLFLYGAPGNGKTSVAVQLTACYPDHIWIPRSITVGGEILRLFDPSVHEIKDVDASEFSDYAEEYDRRWVLIRRPTVVVGGELTLEHLEIREQVGSKVLEAPVQMKSNCGTLLIDDFGRQRVSPTEILNRWIVPLERNVDYLTLPSGRQIRVPFNQTLVLATNLEPTELVDEAFLRRIPYKVELVDPTESCFRELFVKTAASLKIELEEGCVDYLIQTHFTSVNRPFRFCHPRDLLWQVGNLCDLHALPRVATPRTLDAVVRNYFATQQRFANRPRRGT